MTVQTILPYLQLFMNIGTICVMVYTLVKFLGKPHTNLETRVTACEVELKDIKQSLLQGNDRFREQETTNEVMQSCMLALIDFELAYCIHTSYEDTEDLMRAKTELRKHLARK